MEGYKSGIYIVITFFITLLFSCSDKSSSDEIRLAADQARTELLFDFDWQFHRGESEGAEDPDFDDSHWRTLDLPHDWSIEDIPGTASPIDSQAIGGISAGYTVGGTGWYRKSFVVPDNLEGKTIRIMFEGVHMNADIWLNNQHLGNHPYGYTSFWYDISDKLIYGEKNLIAVEVKNEGRNSRWYTGSGIYRHVWLTILEPVHIEQWGVNITTSGFSDETTRVNVKTNISNRTPGSRKLLLTTSILDASGKKIATTTSDIVLYANTSVKSDQVIYISHPELWSVESPALYTAVSEVRMQGEDRLSDRKETVFGIRNISFSNEEGFLLNGKPVLMKGACMHHDNGPLGSAAFDRAEQRRVELMKASGYNSIRCAHNPPSPAFLDACDRLGMLVIDESFDVWSHGKNPKDYNLWFNEWWRKDIESMVFRDRNHPSVIMWSTGNEIPGMEDPGVVETAKIMTTYVRELDPSRPVTSAVNGLNPGKDPFFAAFELNGYNYAVGGDHWQNSLYEKDHKRVPDRIMYCSESYPLEAFGSWMSVLEYPYVFGDFVWTGFDYLGEASIGWMGYPHEGSFYPWLHAYCGDIDICGFKRPQSFYRDVLWMENQLSVFIHDVYSSCPEVELFLDGESLGRKYSTRENEFTPHWEIPYRTGTLKAIGYSGGTEVASTELISAGEPKRLELSADRTGIRADGQDLSYVVVDILDEAGIRNPKARNLIRFEIEGPGTIAAVGSSDPYGLESFRRPQRKAYQGRCLVIIRSGREEGDIILKALSEGLQSAQILVNTGE